MQLFRTGGHRRRKHLIASARQRYARNKGCNKLLLTMWCVNPVKPEHQRSPPLESGKTLGSFDFSNRPFYNRAPCNHDVTVQSDIVSHF